jgi:hypothetical protein
MIISVLACVYCVWIGAYKGMPRPHGHATCNVWCKVLDVVYVYVTDASFIQGYIHMYTMYI